MNIVTGIPAIVVTGASSGLGREIARLAVTDGKPLVLVGRSESELQKLSREIQARGVDAYPLSIDLQHDGAVSRIEALLSAHGLYCDILVNGAGFGVFGAVAEADESLQLQLVDVNVKAPLALTIRFLPGMIARGRGGIINIGSISAYGPGPYMASYSASKAFIRSFSAALSAELAGTGVTVTCLTPGVVRTDFFNRDSMRTSRMIKLLPRGDPVHAANAGWRAFKAGKSIVVPRVIDRFIIRLSWLIPERLLARLVGVLQRAS
jgi:short-subunit dehydrogenase